MSSIISKYAAIGDWRSVEQKLSSEADTLRDLLAMLRKFVPPSLLDEAGWRPVLAAAELWPSSLGALPFGFEFHLRDPKPRADFGITLGAGGKTAAWIARRANAAAAPEFLRRLSRLLDEMGTDASPVGRELGRAMLEVDLVSISSAAPRDPGVFLYYNYDGGGAPRDSRAVLAALNAACGWPDEAAEFRLARRFALAVKPPASFVSLGAFPGRGRGFRLTASGFPTSADALSFLRGIGWPGRYDLLTDVLERMTRQRAFGTLGLMLYGRGENPRSKLGLYLRTASDGWPDTFEALAAEGCVAAKLAGLRAAVDGPRLLWGKTGEFRLLRETTHIKLVLDNAGCEDIKAYFGLALAP